MVHGYLEINLDVVWETLQEWLPTLLKQLPAVGEANEGASGPVCKKSITKQIRDRRSMEPMRGRSRLCDALKLAGGPWTSHDLRRTCTTLMVDLGMSPDVAHLCTYHLEQDRIKRTYNRARQAAAQQEAWRLLGELLALLSQQDNETVVVARFRPAARGG